MPELSIRKIIEKTLSGEIRIPSFQRGFVWEPEKVAFFIDSLCCACSPFFVGVGNSFHNAFWVYLRYHQGRRPVQNGRDEKPMRPDRPGPPYEGM